MIHKPETDLELAERDGVDIRDIRRMPESDREIMERKERCKHQNKNREN